METDVGLRNGFKLSGIHFSAAAKRFLPLTPSFSFFIRFGNSFSLHFDKIPLMKRFLSLSGFLELNNLMVVSCFSSGSGL